MRQITVRRRMPLRTVLCRRIAQPRRPKSRRAQGDRVNYCGYCLLPHSRKSCGCCTEHARKVGARRAHETRARNRAHAAIMARVHHKARVRPIFRQLAMGLGDEAANVYAIFGVRRIPPMRDTAE